MPGCHFLRNTVFARRDIRQCQVNFFHDRQLSAAEHAKNYHALKRRFGFTAASSAGGLEIPQ